MSQLESSRIRSGKDVSNRHGPNSNRTDPIQSNVTQIGPNQPYLFFFDSIKFYLILFDPTQSYSILFDLTRYFSILLDLFRSYSTLLNPICCYSILFGTFIISLGLSLIVLCQIIYYYNFFFYIDITPIISSSLMGINLFDYHIL